MSAALFLVTVTSAALALTWVLGRSSKANLHRFSAVSLGVLEELMHQPHAAEHQRLETHTAFLKDDDGDGDGDGLR